MAAGRKEPTKKYQKKSFSNSFKNGNLVTKLSLVVWGLGNLVHKQIIHGLLLLGAEIFGLYYMVTTGVKSIRDFTTLGTNAQEEVFNEAKQVYEYVKGDNSMLCLLYGVVTIAFMLLLIFLATVSVRSAYKSQKLSENGKPIPGFLEDLKSLKQANLHTTLLFLPITGILVFTVIPLIFMILMAFTSYDRDHQPPGNLFGWVGLVNFQAMFAKGSDLANTFWPILAWTLTWAVVATFSCYILGMLLAIVINRKETRGKGFWRFVFVLSIAIPQFVSLLTMRSIFNGNGPMNVILRHLNFIGSTESVNFLTDPTMAKITIILVNLWIGIPYTMLQTTGILQNIPSDLYEAAKVDGAGPIKTFFKITLPYMLFVTGPYLITTFVGNINNFNVIFLLSGGGPDKLEYYYAGRTDLLITWLYKLTITQKDYNLGAVIGIVTFVIMATISLLTYRNIGAYKNEDTFQ